MKTIQQFPSWFSKQKLSGKLAIGCTGLFIAFCLCSFVVSILSPSKPASETASTPVDVSGLQTAAFNTALAGINQVTATNASTNTPEPTQTPIPPTSTQNPNLINPGTYLVGVDIKPGIYSGQAGDGLFDSCYWARLKDLSGTLDSMLANDNGIGQFYVEVRNNDYALETRCELVLLDSLSPTTGEFPQTIPAGTYIVGKDIQPGTYKGQAGNDISASCYWARLANVAGGMDAIIANDNAVGQYYVQVAGSDFALSTACELQRVGD